MVTVRENLRAVGAWVRQKCCPAVVIDDGDQQRKNKSMSSYSVLESRRRTEHFESRVHATKINDC